VRIRAHTLIAPLAVCLLLPQLVQADAATKAREGEINHWIEYYRRERMIDRPERPTREEAERPPPEEPPRNCGENKCSAPEPSRELIR
jgi:hypothetical protein